MYSQFTHHHNALPIRFLSLTFTQPSHKHYTELWDALQIVKEVGSEEPTSAVDLAVYSQFTHHHNALPSFLSLVLTSPAHRQYTDLWDALQVVKEVGSEERTSAVDLAVYSRTRHFRTAWSCKGGK